MAGAHRRKDRPRRPNATGRTDKSARFVMLPYRILESVAYASLDLTARAILTELVMLYRGDNNGEIFLSAADATARLGLSDKHPALRAFDDLRERGFVTVAKDAHFNIKAADSSRARCWRLTWHAWPECPVRSKRAPTNEWEQYAPPGQTPASKRADKRLRALAAYRKAQGVGNLPGEDFTPTTPKMGQIGKGAGEDFTPAARENVAVPPFPVGVKSTPYLDTTKGSLDVVLESTARKQAIPSSGANLASLRELLIGHLRASEPGEQSRLAFSLGIPGGTLSRFINGRTLPDRHAVMLAKGLAIEEAA